MSPQSVRCVSSAVSECHRIPLVSGQPRRRSHITPPPQRSSILRTHLHLEVCMVKPAVCKYSCEEAESRGPLSPSADRRHPATHSPRTGDIPRLFTSRPDDSIGSARREASRTARAWRSAEGRGRERGSSGVQPARLFQRGAARSSPDGPEPQERGGAG